MKESSNSGNYKCSIYFLKAHGSGLLGSGWSHECPLQKDSRPGELPRSLILWVQPGLGASGTLNLAMGQGAAPPGGS